MISQLRKVEFRVIKTIHGSTSRSYVERLTRSMDFNCTVISALGFGLPTQLRLKSKCENGFFEYVMHLITSSLYHIKKQKATIFTKNTM